MLWPPLKLSAAFLTDSARGFTVSFFAIIFSVGSRSLTPDKPARRGRSGKGLLIFLGLLDGVNGPRASKSFVELGSLIIFDFCFRPEADQPWTDLICF